MATSEHTDSIQYTVYGKLHKSLADNISAMYNYLYIHLNVPVFAGNEFSWQDFSTCTCIQVHICIYKYMYSVRIYKNMYLQTVHLLAVDSVAVPHSHPQPSQPLPPSLSLSLSLSLYLISHTLTSIKCCQSTYCMTFLTSSKTHQMNFKFSLKVMWKLHDKSNS